MKSKIKAAKHHPLPPSMTMPIQYQPYSSRTGKNKETLGVNEDSENLTEDTEKSAFEKAKDEFIQ